VRVLRDIVVELERAYSAGVVSTDRSLAAAGAVASRYLAVGTPRSFAIVGDGDGALDSLAAHRTWGSAPTDVRCTDARVAAAIGGRAVPLADALAADIVCIHEALALAAAQLRRGTHVNALARVELDDDLRRLATIVDEARELPRIVSGVVDGRQLDELTIFVATCRDPS
jgi:ornithine cyclodeaminase/alanine dehydrogenase-like protein (mu-crystallin family)